MKSALVLFLVAGCSDGGGGSGGDAGSNDGGARSDGGAGGCAVVPSDITCEAIDGAWVFENASGTPDTISNRGDLALSAGGAIAVAFAEPLPDPVSDQDIYVAGRDACGWEPSSPLTKDTALQNSYPSLAVEGETFHLVWSGPAAGSNDVYYAANSGSSWTTPVNLTADYESQMMRHGYAPAISIGPGGAIAIAYLSAPADPQGGFAGPSEVRVAALEADTLAGPPETAIDAGDGGCSDPMAIHDGDGDLHVLAECEDDIIWATDAGPGPWRAEPMPGTAGHADSQASVAGWGGAVHAAWAADLPCGDGTCRTLQYSALDGGSWTDPVSASQGGAPADYAPSLAVAADGTVYVAFWRDNADNKADVYLTSSRGGASFAPPCNLTRTEGHNEWMPAALQIHPQTGKLHLLYEQFVPGSDPLDTEIIHAFIL